MSNRSERFSIALGFGPNHSGLPNFDKISQKLRVERGQTEEEETDYESMGITKDASTSSPCECCKYLHSLNIFLPYKCM